MAGDTLGLARFADHKQLWKNSHRLQIDGERPQDLKTGFTRLLLLNSIPKVYKLFISTCT